MANLATAFAGGFESGQAIGDTIVADRDLKQAQSESGPGADLFTTYQKAGQMAMQSGNTRVADKFLKQANEFKGEALKQHISELKVHQGEVEALYQDLQGSKTKEDLLGRVNNAAANGRLSEAEKLEYSGAINKLTDEQVPAFIEEAGKKTLGYKEQLEVQSKIAHDALEQDKFKEEKRHHIVQERNEAIRASGKSVGKLSPEDKELQTELHEDVRGIRADAKSEIDAVNKNYGLNDAQKAAKIVGIKKRRDEAIKASRDEFKHRNDEESSEPAKAKPISVSPEEVKSMSQKNIQQLIDGSVSEKEFEDHYGKPPGWAKKVVDVYRNKDTKTGAGQKTHDGYPARENADGSYSTEVSITVTNPKLNNGKPTNIPSLWKGKEVDEDTAVRNALATGKSYKAFNSINEAVTAAKARSEAGGAGADSKKELTDEEQLAKALSKATGVQERNAIRNDYNIRQERKAKEAKQKAIAAKGKEKTEATVAKAQKQGLVLSGMSGTQLKFVDPKTGKEVLEYEL